MRGVTALRLSVFMMFFSLRSMNVMLGGSKSDRYPYTYFVEYSSINRKRINRAQSAAISIQIAM